MKSLALIFNLLICYVAGLYAQNTITGTVTDNTGESLPQATVYVKGKMTSTGTVTDFDGQYSVAAQANDTLVFSFVGLETQEIAINGRTNIDVVLIEKTLEGVVITAIGIKKGERMLGYSATTVQNDELTRGADRSLVNALQGKVAGVNITQASGAPGSSSRIILRGYSSLVGSNQPLFIIDGVPINNSAAFSVDLNNGTDFGNRANDINPDDVASVTILKGASGTALYGSRAANGVIVITTKKGTGNESGKARIKISSMTTLYRPLRLPEFQNEYGQGIYGNAVPYENMSWGPKFDGQWRYYGNEYNRSRQIKPYEALPNNVSEFFETGRTFNNSVSIANGNDIYSYYFSYTNTNDDGFFPTDVDVYNRHTLMLKGSAKIKKNITSSAALTYINKTNSYVPTGQEQSVLDNIMQTPRDISLLDLEDYENNPFAHPDNYYSRYTLNPWYVLQEHGNEQNEDRAFGSANLAYEPLEWLSLSWRVGLDVANFQRREWRAVVDPQGTNANFDYNDDPGRVREYFNHTREITSDLMLNINKSLGEKLEASLLIGQNMNARRSHSLWSEVVGLDIEEYYDLRGSASTPEVVPFRSQKRLMGVYANIDITYNNYLTLTLTGRNDWSSTLPQNNNSFFYPSVNMAFVYTDVIKALDGIIDYGKLRAGWAQVGQDAVVPYATRSVFVTAGHTDGFGSYTYPTPTGITGFSVEDAIANPNLQPEISTEYEIGTDMRFVHNRIRLDFTYYNKKVEEMIWYPRVAPTSGYASQTMNISSMTNRGIELLLGFTPIKRNNGIIWDFSFNFSNNRNELNKITDETDQTTYTGLNTITGMLYTGYPVMVLVGDVPQTTKFNGQECIIVDANGHPIAKPEKEILGDTQYDFILGFNTRISYKGLTVSTVVDWRQGGVMYSRTASITHFAGTTPYTLYNDRQPWIIPNSVQNISNDPDKPEYIENTTPVTGASNTNLLHQYFIAGGDQLDRTFVIDKSFIKLREVTVYYDFPAGWFENNFVSGITLALIGRNLLLWTPKENQFIDPEVTTFGNDLEADFGEFQAIPSARSVGAGLKVYF